MSVAAVAEKLINSEASSRRVKRIEARDIIARESGVSTWTLENLLRGRLKFADRLAGRLNDLLERKLESQMRELEHELAILRAQNSSARQSDLLGAAAALDAAREALGKPRLG